MKNKLLKIIIIIFVLFTIPLTTNADTFIYDDYTNEMSKYDYIINSYDIQVIVNENNILDITETISTYFREPKHGIYRKIPYKNKIKRLDGTTSSNQAKISDIAVNEEYTTYTENGYEVIQIGRANYTITGEKTYQISYSYNLGKDTGKDYDELYFNLIGEEWDTIINNITFTITMPKEFDENKLGFANGVVGSTENNVTYNVNDNVITGQLNGYLKPGEALTVRLELPEGYFVGAGLPRSIMLILYFAVPIIVLLISFFIWYRYGKDNKVIETIEFYPPDNLNSLEVAFYYKGKAESEDVTSLLIYLANKGYLKISEKGLTSFKIEKAKEYDSDNELERIFFEGLFKDKDIITKSDLENKFYRTNRKILEAINTKENKNKIFEQKATKKKRNIIILLLLAIITVLGIPSYEYGGIGGAIIIIILTLFYTPFYAVSFYMKGIVGLFVFVFTTVHSTIFIMTMPFTQSIINEPLYLIGSGIGLICIIGIAICLKEMPKRTAYGNEMLGKIKGFKTFLETVEKPQLEQLVMQNKRI